MFYIIKINNLFITSIIKKLRKSIVIDLTINFKL